MGSPTYYLRPVKLFLYFLLINKNLNNSGNIDYFIVKFSVNIDNNIFKKFKKKIYSNINNSNFFAILKKKGVLGVFWVKGHYSVKIEPKQLIKVSNDLQ